MSKIRCAIKIPMLPPTQFMLSVMKSTGQFSNEYPTFILSYMGLSPDYVPDDMLLSDIQAVGVDFNPESTSEEFTAVEMYMYVQPKKELLDFSDCYYFKCPVPTLESNSFFKKIDELGRYVILINTEFYTYRALIDNDSGEVLEASVDYRLLN